MDESEVMVNSARATFGESCRSCAAMIRSGAMDPDDHGMVAKTLDAAGDEIDILHDALDDAERDQEEKTRIEILSLAIDSLRGTVLDTDDDLMRRAIRMERWVRTGMDGEEP